MTDEKRKGGPTPFLQDPRTVGFQLEAPDHDAIRAEARRLRISVAQVLRNALSRYAEGLRRKQEAKLHDN